MGLKRCVTEAGEHQRCANKPAQGKASLRATPWVKRPAKSSSHNGAGQKLPHELQPTKLFRPVGALPILYFQTQGGARSSLALGWLVAGRWPEETMLAHEYPMLRLKIRCLTSKRADKPAQGNALGSEYIKIISPEGAA